MKRSSFIGVAVLLPLLAVDAAAGTTEIPSELRGGRFFALPRTRDGRTFACWRSSRRSIRGERFRRCRAARCRSSSDPKATAPLDFDGFSPRLHVTIGGRSMRMAFDIAASVAYAPRFARGEPVRATSFIPHATLEDWHARFPHWRVDRNLAVAPGVDRIVVPEVTVGNALLRDVAFTTRPQDDVFMGDSAQGKLGANAYGDRMVTIDYPNGRLRLQ